MVIAVVRACVVLRREREEGGERCSRSSGKYQ